MEMPGLRKRNVATENLTGGEIAKESAGLVFVGGVAGSVGATLLLLGHSLTVDILQTAGVLFVLVALAAFGAGTVNLVVWTLARLFRRLP